MPFCRIIFVFVRGLIEPSQTVSGASCPASTAGVEERKERFYTDWI